MPANPLVCHGNQPLVKAALIRTTLITADQQNALPLWVKGECNSPHLTGLCKPQLLHVRVLRAFERVLRGSPQTRSEVLQQEGMGQQFILQRLRQCRKLQGKVIVK